MPNPLMMEMLDAISRIEPCRVESTLLSIGGRGYYENPTSDLLKFFLEPGNEHGLGSLFLDAFLAAAGLGNENLSLASLSIDREAYTDDKKRIDLLIRGDRWIMLIENKIWHHESNPFDSYDRLAKQLAIKERFFKCILSPFATKAPEGWNRVTYAGLLDQLEPGLLKCSDSKKTDKWWHFASDFALHLRNEMYARTMKDESVEFAEKYYPQMQKAIELSRQYRKHLLLRMGEVASDCIERDRFCLKDEGWALRIYFPEWRDANFAWWHDHENGFVLKGAVYINSPSDEEQQRLRAVVDDLGLGRSEKMEGSWVSISSIEPFSNPGDAASMLRECLKILKSLYEA